MTETTINCDPELGIECVWIKKNYLDLETADTIGQYDGLESIKCVL